MPDQRRQRWIDLTTDAGSHDITRQRIGATRRSGGDASLAFQQGGGAAILQVQGEAIVALDAQQPGFHLAIFPPALGRGGDAPFRRFGAETLAQDDVHHLLRRRIAVGEGDLFGQYVDPLHRFGRNILNFGKAGYALAVQQDDRRPVGLRRQFGDQFRYGGDAQRAHVGGGQLLFGLDIADYRSALRLAGDDDFFAFVHFHGGCGLLFLLRHQGAGRDAGHERDTE